MLATVPKLLNGIELGGVNGQYPKPHSRNRIRTCNCGVAHQLTKFNHHGSAKRYESVEGRYHRSIFYPADGAPLDIGLVSERLLGEKFSPAQSP